ncbi:1-acyl-sn-glycerol-3-phosphate acyltransferase [Tautonia rosea]|uniref:1-acyl-sn-glycerol-3-phosphate acyltransferase n=1 Tax=Tautonia rosea TaxID=2728037 RepID=UPI0014731686|nr:1-acyl-sn-glycerol-3-phosphate acyltransferase [Tautonia rosea]
MSSLPDLFVWIGAALAVLVFLALCPLLILMVVAAVYPDGIQSAVRFVLTPVYRLRIIGLEHLPKTGPVLVIANHVSWIDGFLLAGSVPRRGRALVFAPYLKIPIVGPLAKRSGMIPVPDRGPKAQRAMLRAAFEVLDNGEVLGMFPEGQISRTGVMGTLYRGVEVIASGRKEATIIPVYLDNLWGSIFSFSGGRFFRKWPRGIRRTIIVSFGPPIDRPLTVFNARQAIIEAGVRAFEHRPERDKTILPETIDLSLPHLTHPEFGLLTASAPNFARGIIRQTGHKDGSVGQPVPGVALRVVDADGHPLPPDTEGRLQVLRAGNPNWHDLGRTARIERDGFVFLTQPTADPEVRSQQEPTAFP